jgi:hypothetical protein
MNYRHPSIAKNIFKLFNHGYCVISLPDFSVSRGGNPPITRVGIIFAVMWIRIGNVKQDPDPGKFIPDPDPDSSGSEMNLK